MWWPRFSNTKPQASPLSMLSKSHCLPWEPPSALCFGPSLGTMGTVRLSLPLLRGSLRRRQGCDLLGARSPPRVDYRPLPSASPSPTCPSWKPCNSQPVAHPFQAAGQAPSLRPPGCPGREQEAGKGEDSIERVPHGGVQASGRDASDVQGGADRVRRSKGGVTTWQKRELEMWDQVSVAPALSGEEQEGAARRLSRRWSSGVTRGCPCGVRALPIGGDPVPG